MKKAVKYIECVVNASYFAHMFSSNKLKINRIFHVTALLLIVQMSESQGIITKQATWQQGVEYQIEVVLNDNDHLLTGNIAIRYVNNSKDELGYILMHLWPNAYKNSYTTFGQQLLGNGKTDFYFADDEDRGWIDSLDFNVDGEKVAWALDSEYIDIARLDLNDVLKPGGSITIETPFKVKIPGSFSRFGHVKDAYQITQWYPKPAVYDVNGWNAIAYLDQGEFYSEFGSFEVKITLPEDFVVSATGELQEEEEWDYLRKRENNPLSPTSQKEIREGASSPVLKTLTFKQNNIHDFAWFADRTFNVKTKDVQLPSGDSVKIMIFTNEKFNPKKGANYISYTEKTLAYYSQNIGNYPYKYCSVVQGALVSGGGMEYPMVTVIPYLSEEVIVHEVGHNWFFGIIGSNERTYPWMDESINSYYENRTIDDYSNKLSKEIDPLGAINMKDLANDPNGMIMGLLYSDSERRWEHQPIGAPSEVFTGLNYGTMVYGKGSQAFVYLEAFLGKPTLDQGFRIYFDQWKFRHPLPDDLQTALETASEKNLSWFFDDYLISDDRLDYSIELVDIGAGKATIRNNGGIVAPFPLDYILDDRIVQTVWIDGFEGEKEIDLLDVAYSALKIDARHFMTESYTRNNTYRLNVIFPKLEKLKSSRFFTLEDPNRTQLTLSVGAGWNSYDKLMLGLVVSNIRIPRQKMEFIATPMFGLGSNDLVGYGDIRYTSYYKGGTLSSSQIGINYARFGHELAGIYNDKFTYSRMSPFIEWNFSKPSARSKIKRSVMLRATLIDFKPFNSDEDKLKDIEATDTSRRTSFVKPNSRQFIDLTYTFDDKRALNPYGFKLNIQSGMVSGKTTWLDSTKTTDEEVFAKVEFTGKYRVSYPFHKKGLDIRLFIGKFIDPAIASAFQFPFNNSNTEIVQPDYTNAYSQMGRGVHSGIFTNQLIENGPFLKNLGMINTADDWIAAVNLETGLPFKFKAGIYMDVFTSNNIELLSGDEESRFGYSGGLYVDLIPEFLKVYVPLFASPFIVDAQELQGVDKLSDKISFTLNLNLFNPFQFREKLNNMM